MYLPLKLWNSEFTFFFQIQNFKTTRCLSTGLCFKESLFLQTLYAFIKYPYEPKSPKKNKEPASTQMITVYGFFCLKGDKLFNNVNHKNQYG